MWIQVSAHVCIDRQKVASMSKEAKHFTQYLRQEHPDCNKSLNRYIFSRRVSRNCMPFVREKKKQTKKPCVVTQYQRSNLFYGVSTVQLHGSWGYWWESGQGKGRKEMQPVYCTVWMYSRCCNALECMDGGKTHFVPSYRGKKSGAKCRFLLKNRICMLVSMWNSVFLFLAVFINTVTYLLSEVS